MHEGARFVRPWEIKRRDATASVGARETSWREVAVLAGARDTNPRTLHLCAVPRDFELRERAFSPGSARPERAKGAPSSN